MALYEYRIGVAVVATGTVTISGGSKNVIGDGTLFRTEIVVGDLIVVAGQVRVVETAMGPEDATVTVPWSSSATDVAFDYVSLDNVEDLGLPAPKGNEPTPYSKPVRLGDGTVRGLGWTATTWRFDVLTQAQRDVLKAYCPAMSANVYVRTRKQSLAYANYSAVMVWPPQERRQAGRALDLEVVFQRMVEV